MTSSRSVVKGYSCLFLTGMPGVGKTWWGHRIALAHGFSFVDLDAFIAKQEGMSIAALFHLYGEDGFRNLERSYLQKLIADISSFTIVACGGGTPCFFDNMELMKDTGTVVYLHASVAYLMGHLKKESHSRPLLQERNDLPAFLATLLQRREPLYREAHYILQARDISLTTFDKIISTCISRQ